MADFDIQIKGGTVVDGTRVPRYRGDVWIKDGKIAQIGGRAPGFAKKVIDADGLIVAPGFVDLHTHYDAQIRWDPYCTISGWHGVTSLVLGNCGFGFAPCKPDFRERSMLTMTRTEAIPYDAMKAGMNWDWETIPEYLDSLDRAPKGVNCIQYMPTASLMTYVMGLEAAKTRPATEEERAEMAPAARRRAWTPASADSRFSASAEFGAGRLRRLADGHRHHVRRGHPQPRPRAARARRRLHRNHPGHRRHQGRPRFRRDSSPTRRSARSCSRRSLPTRNDPEIHRRSLRWIEAMPRQGPADLRPGRDRPQRLRLHPRTLEPLRHRARLARADHRHHRREDAPRCSDPELRAAVKQRATDANARLKASRPGVGGRSASLIVQWVE